MIYSVKPLTFKNKFDIVSCFCIKGEKILLLHRQDHKPQGDTWGIPAGKVDNNEERVIAVQRELKEETGLDIPIEKLHYIDKVYTRYPEYDFTFYMYQTVIDEDVAIHINSKEHKGFRWVSPQNTRIFNLMEDLEECIKRYCK